MATILATAVDIEAFVSTDIYRFDVDNRPLLHLMDNDIAMNTELEATTAEVVQARTGLLQTYASLDARLDDLELAAGYPQKQIAFNEFMARAQTWQARYASGAIFPVTEVVKISDMWSTSASLLTPIDGNNGNPAFGQLLLRDTNVSEGTLRVQLGNGIGPRFTTGTGLYDFTTYRPIPLTVNGFTVQLFNEAGGALATGKANEITWNLPAAPASNGRCDLLWIEVYMQSVSRTALSFNPYGAVGSLSAALNVADDATLRGNVGFHGGNNGDYFQLRHRLRVTSGVTPDTNPFGMSDALVLAQGAKNAPVATYTFVNGGKSKGDPGVWVAGSGDNTSKTDLGTLDGFVYAIPVALVFRRNTAQWTLANQNGSRTSGGAGTWTTGDSERPDGFYHDKIEKDDVVLVAPSSVTERSNLRRVLNESFDRLLRGELKTKHGYLDYSQQYIEDTVATTNETVGGSQLVAASSISATSEAKTDQFLEATATVVKPDDFRRLFSPQTETQPVGFTIDVAGLSGVPSNFASYGTNIITLKAIGQGAGVGQAAAVINEAPVLWWSGSKKPVAITGSWSGLGTGTITATVNTGDGNYAGTGTIVGLSKITFIATTGIKKANVATVGQTYVTPAAASHKAQSLKMLGTDVLLGPSAVAIDATYMYVADRIAHKVYKVNRSTLAVTNTFGVYKTSGSDNTHLFNPSAIAVDGSGNVYVADTSNHRVVKLNSSLVYQSQFGVTATPGSGATKLNYPLGVTVDGSGNVYVSDSSNYRVAKLDNTLTYSAQFGVTGLALPDNTHCVFPKHCFFGDDSNLYVADQSRILIINPSTMAAISFIEHGYQIPAARAASPSVISPYGSLNSIREDSSGNKYVLHSTGAVPVLGSANTGYMLTKYDSTWGYLARYGSYFDTTSVYGGINAGTTNGLLFAIDMALDEGNDTIHIFETNDSYWAVLGGNQNRIVSIKMSDLALRQIRASNPTTLTAGTFSPYGPFIGYRLGSSWAGDPVASFGINWPELRFKSVEFDATNHYAYIAYGGPVAANGTQIGWQRVEKWSAAGTDPNAWSMTAAWGAPGIGYFGGIGYRWVSWLGSPHDATNPLSISPYGNGITMNRDGSAVFVADNHSVVKLNTSGSTMTYVGRFGTAGVPGNDSSHLSFPDFGGGAYPYSNYWGGVQSFCASEAESTGRIYVADGNNQRLVILRNVNGGIPTYSASYTGSRFQYINLMNGASYALTTGAAKLWVKAVTGPDSTIYELNIAGSNRDAPLYVDANATSFATVYVPLTLAALPTSLGFSFFGVTKISGLLYWTDFNTDQVVAAQTPDFRFIGECGTPGVGGKDLASWAHPTGIAADADNIYLCDFGNARILVSDPHLAYIEPSVGRAEFLTPPEVGSKFFAYEKFTTMQEVSQRGRPSITATISNPADRYPRLTGRSVLVAPESMLVTSLGKGSIEAVADPAIAAYSNCIQRLPIPPGYADEYAARPTDFTLAGNGVSGRPFFFTPLVSASSSSHGNYPNEGASSWQKDTILTFLDSTLATAGLRGGYQAVGYLPGPPGFQTAASPTGPKLTAPNCGTAPGYRYVATPFLVTVEGEVLLAIRVAALSGGNLSNELGISATEIVGLYRPVGHPMLPDNGEADTAQTIV